MNILFHLQPQKIAQLYFDQNTPALDKDQIKQLTQENEELRAQYEALAAKERYLDVINSFATSLIEQNSIDEIVWDVAKNAIAKLEFVDCVIYLYDEERKYLVQRAAHGPKNPIEFDIVNPMTLKVGEGVVGHVVQTGEPVIISDTREDDRYILDDVARLSEIAVPIMAKNGEVVGVIDSEHPEAHFFTDLHLEVLTTIASITATKIMQANAQNSLKKQQDQLEETVRLRTREIEEAVDELRRSNSEKEVLLKEIHHRVKNNMQVINSLIRLQSMQVADPQVLSLFKEAQNRVISMALIHEKLYQSHDFSSIRIDDYFDELASNLLYSYQLENDVKFNLKLDVTTMHIDTLIPLGLIFNEVISNSLQHAFEERENGEISIVLERIENERIRLRLADNGIGMTNDSKWENPETLGLDLIKTLVDQIDGTIEKVTDHGTAFIIEFDPRTKKSEH